MQQLQSGTTLQGGKYKIERVLGQGGFGNTYVGVNTVFNEPVAIKEFFMQGINDRDEATGSITISIEQNKEQFLEQLEKFKKEALRIRKFNNDHIVHVHDLFEENGTAYYVMDFIDGESLAERLKRTGKPMKVEEVQNILPQLLDALKTVHDAGIWHLDLKPANIMIDKESNVKLIDFGASKQLNTQKGGATTSTAISYTNGYAPREQMEQNYDKFGPWTDLYALGATLYTLLSNKRPPLPTDIDDDISEDKHLALPLPPDAVNSTLHELILWMMSTNRNRRPQNVEEITKNLSKISTDNEQTEVLFNKGKDIDETDEETIIAPKEIEDTQIDSEETILSGSKIINDYALNDFVDENNVHAVDLGLSILWADCNVGANSSCPAGGLYGWGDVTGKMKSCLECDYIPTFDALLSRIEGDMACSKFDIATKRWGQKWRMPNRKQWEELSQKCQWINEGNRYKVIGPNGNYIFLPFTGMRIGDKVSYKDQGFYWTCEINKSESDYFCAYYFCFSKYSRDKSVDTFHYVYSGRAIRPVFNK